MLFAAIAPTPMPSGSRPAPATGSFICGWMFLISLTFCIQNPATAATEGTFGILQEVFAARYGSPNSALGFMVGWARRAGWLPPWVHAAAWQLGCSGEPAWRESPSAVGPCRAWLPPPSMGAVGSPAADSAPPQPLQRPAHSWQGSPPVSRARCTAAPPQLPPLPPETTLFLCLQVIFFIASNYCGVFCITANSRLLYAFSRDNGVLGSKWWKQVGAQ